MLGQMTRLAQHFTLRALRFDPLCTPRPNPMRDLCSRVYMMKLKVALGAAVNAHLSAKEKAPALGNILSLKFPLHVAVFVWHER